MRIDAVPGDRRGRGDDEQPRHRRRCRRLDADAEDDRGWLRPAQVERPAGPVVRARPGPRPAAVRRGRRDPRDCARQHLRGPRRRRAHAADRRAHPARHGPRPRHRDPARGHRPGVPAPADGRRPVGGDRGLRQQLAARRRAGRRVRRCRRRGRSGVRRRGSATSSGASGVPRSGDDQSPRRSRASAPGSPVTQAKVLFIDNYDSFVYNLVQYVGELGARSEVVRNDAVSVD